MPPCASDSWASSRQLTAAATFASRFPASPKPLEIARTMLSPTKATQTTISVLPSLPCGQTSPSLCITDRILDHLLDAGNTRQPPAPSFHFPRKNERNLSMTLDCVAARFCADSLL